MESNPINVFLWNVPRGQREAWVHKALDLYLSGASQTEAAAALCCGLTGVRNWFRRFAKYRQRGLCGCGRAANHIGRCAFRRAKNSA